MRPQPEWLITDDFSDNDLGALKTGKEAEVFLVERVNGARSCLLAHKRYRPRDVAKGELQELGFTRATAFARDDIYREGKKLSPKAHRERRAMAKRTAFGRTLLAASWTGHEFDVMERLWNAGVDVPYPVSPTHDGFLMQFVGDRNGAAPRLAQARLDRSATTDAFAQLVDNLVVLMREGVVHADLSPYNMLWWEGRLWLIDFPQAVDQAHSPHFLDLLHRDLVNVCTWFTRRGLVGADPDVLFGTLLSELTLQ